MQNSNVSSEISKLRECSVTVFAFVLVAPFFVFLVFQRTIEDFLQQFLREKNIKLSNLAEIALILKVVHLIRCFHC